MSTFYTGLNSDLSIGRLGKPNGFAPLGIDGKVPSINLPAGLAGGLALQGGYDASTNTPDLTAGAQQTDGALYIVTIEGTQDIGNGSELFTVGDAVFYSTGDGRWYKLEGSTLGIEVSYDNTGTAILATNIQDAIDELASNQSIKLTADTTFYINSSTGSDITGDGTSASPWATIQFAIDYVERLDCNGFTPTIQGNGNFVSEGIIHLPPILNPKSITCGGGISSPDNCHLIIRGGTYKGFEADQHGYYTLFDLNLVSSSPVDVNIKALRSSYISVGNVQVSSTSGVFSFGPTACQAESGAHISLYGNFTIANGIKKWFTADEKSYVGINKDISNLTLIIDSSYSHPIPIAFDVRNMSLININENVTFLNNSSLTNQDLFGASVIRGGNLNTLFSTNLFTANNLNYGIINNFYFGDVIYENTTSGLTATNVQDAIDELANITTGTLPTLPQQDIYIRTDGNDSNTGFTDDAAGALASINGAFALLEQYEGIPTVNINLGTNTVGTPFIWDQTGAAAVFSPKYKTINIIGGTGNTATTFVNGAAFKGLLPFELVLFPALNDGTYYIDHLTFVDTGVIPTRVVATNNQNIQIRGDRVAFQGFYGFEATSGSSLTSTAGDITVPYTGTYTNINPVLRAGQNSQLRARFSYPNLTVDGVVFARAGTNSSITTGTAGGITVGSLINNAVLFDNEDGAGTLVNNTDVINYDNTSSGLSANDYQTAIDELANNKVSKYSFGTVVNAGSGNAVFDELSLIDSSTSVISVIPPSSPQPYSKFAISDVGNNASVNNITIEFITANQPIFSSADNYIINEDGGFVEFLYINSSIGWITIKG